MSHILFVTCVIHHVANFYFTMKKINKIKIIPCSYNYKYYKDWCYKTIIDKATKIWLTCRSIYEKLYMYMQCSLNYSTNVQFLLTIIKVAAIM